MSLLVGLAALAPLPFRTFRFLHKGTFLPLLCLLFLLFLILLQMFAGGHHFDLVISLVYAICGSGCLSSCGGGCKMCRGMQACSFVEGKKAGAH